MTAFTVDATGELAPGRTLTATPVADALAPDTPAAFAQHAQSLLPHGAGPHGVRHLLDPVATWDAYAELVLELTRRAEAPERPSRLSALFAFTTLEDAEAFRAQRRRPDSPIFTVEAPADAFAGDQHLAGVGPTALVTAAYASAYWRGEAHPDAPPLWELVLPLPVTLGDRVA